MRTVAALATPRDMADTKAAAIKERESLEVRIKDS
jgi:hypothetical protein